MTVIMLYCKYIIMGVTFREIPKFRVTRDYIEDNAKKKKN